MRGVSYKFIDRVIEKEEVCTRKYFYWLAFNPDSDSPIAFEIMRCPVENYIRGIVYGSAETVYTVYDREV